MSGVPGRAAAAGLAWIALACASGAAGPPPSDADLLVHRLLALEHPAFAAGEGYDALAELRAWEDLYLRSRDRALADAGPAHASVKTFLLVGWLAREQYDAATSEAFTGDLMPLYRARPGAVLAALADVPLLVTSTCDALGAWFGFEDRHAGELPAFLAAERERIRAALPERLGATCLAALEGAGEP